MWLTVQSVFFSFLFLSLHDSFRDPDGRGHLWIDVRGEGVGMACAYPPTRHVVRHFFLSHVRGRRSA